MSIKEQIAKLVKGEYPNALVWLDRAVGDGDQTEVGTIADLKALADSHTKLLNTLRQIRSDIDVGMEQGVPSGSILSGLMLLIDPAISEAEKL